MTIPAPVRAAAAAAAIVAVAVPALPAAEPTAHEPRYAEAAWWPARLEAERAAYAHEAWPAAPVLVWAGSAAAASGGRSFPQVDAAGIGDPANWRRPDGGPAAQGPDAGTDAVFPPETRVAFKAPLAVRHATLLPGAQVSFGDLQLAGNLWVREGARFTFTHGRFGAPDRDTFVRSDNPKTEMIQNYLRFGKRPDKSVELIGRWRIGDQVFLHSGRFVLGPGCLFQHTDRFPLEIQAGGTLVLLSGATYESRGNYYQKDDLTVRGGILAGTPERPLTADATLGLSFKARGKGKGSGSSAVKASGPQDVGLLLAPGASVAVHSADPTRARLVFRWHRNPQVTYAWGAEKRDGKGDGIEPADLAAMPHGICMRLLGDVRFDGVVLNDVVPGGIQLPDPAAARQWRHVVLGSGNFGRSLGDLVSAWSGPSSKPPAGAAPRASP